MLEDEFAVAGFMAVELNAGLASDQGLEKGLALDGPSVGRAIAMRSAIFQRMRAFMDRYEFLCLPASQVPAFPASRPFVTEIDGEEMYYTLFHPNVVYHKKVKDVVWNKRNWRWETTGLGSMRKLEHAMGK